MPSKNEVKKTAGGRRAHLRPVALEEPQRVVVGGDAPVGGHRGYDDKNDKESSSKSSYLDIPAFLRNQAD